MAITTANKLSESNDNAGAGNTFTTGSVAFANNKLYLIAIYMRGGTTPTISTIAGATSGHSWVAVGNAAGSSPHISVFRMLVTSGATTEALTITTSGAPTAIHWNLDEFTGIDLTGTDGSGAIVQVSTLSTGSSTSGSSTLSAFGDATNNVAYGAYGHNIQEAYTVDASGGWAALSDNQGVTAPVESLLTEWKTGQDLAVTASWTTSTNYRGYAVEIKMAAVAAATQMITVTAL